MISCLVLLCLVYSAVSQDVWTQKKDFQGTGRQFAFAFSLGLKGFLGGGLSSPLSQSLKDFWEYDPVNDTWTQKENFPGYRVEDMIAMSIEQKAYVGVGRFGTEFWEYDGKSNKWNKLADFPGVTRYRAIGFAAGGKAYVGLGPSRDFWEYDPATNTWTKKSDFPGPPGAFCSALNIDGKGYIQMGGGAPVDSNFWQYDHFADRWHKKNSFLAGQRFYPIAFGVGKSGYIGAGFSIQSFNDLWEYNSLNDTWIRRQDFLGARNYGAVFIIDNKAYISVGTSPDARADVWQYSPLMNDIHINPVTKNLCPGSSFAVSYDVVGTPYAENNFAVQMSNSSGSFLSPVTIGSVKSTAAGTITVTIPANTTAGERYRLRVVSDSPHITGADNGADLTINPLTTFYRDADNDGHGNANISLQACTAPVGYATDGADCNDSDNTIFPNAPELCDGKDNNCNGEVDEGIQSIFYRDADGDGYGDPLISSRSCTSPAGYVKNNADCNDQDNTVFPDAPELCDGKDNNCDGITDEGCIVCANVKEPAIVSVRPHSAIVQWAADNDPSVWETDYKTVEDSNWRTITSVGSSRSLIISDLREEQEYNCRIRAVCGNDAGNFTAMRFKTLGAGKSFKVFPNPSNGQFAIDIDLAQDINEATWLELVDVAGRIIHRETVYLNNGHAYEMIYCKKQFASGVYAVRIAGYNKIYASVMIYIK